MLEVVGGAGGGGWRRGSIGSDKGSRNVEQSSEEIIIWFGVGTCLGDENSNSRN